MPAATTARNVLTRGVDRGISASDPRRGGAESPAAAHRRLADATARAQLGETHRLGRYSSCEGAQREILLLAGPAGARLVLDCLAGGLDDARLLARLGSEEPLENARLLCEMYLADHSRGLCGPLSAGDLGAQQLSQPPAAIEGALSADRAPLAGEGHTYVIRELPSHGAVAALRWTRCSPTGAHVTATLRHVIGVLQDYEPARSLTCEAISAGECDPHLSIVALRAELDCLAHSRVLLNRGLREAVQAALVAGVSMSQIAMRCGRYKHDRRGNRSGETSWLARRVGLMAEGGGEHPTQWVRSDTLALIAREGLGLSPNEVEL